MRITFSALVRLATIKGLEVERNGKHIDIWPKDDHGVTAECGSVEEAYSTVYHYEKGKGL